MSLSVPYSSSAPPLRPYQQGAHDAVFEAFAAGSMATLLVMPTGCGKTRIATAISKSWIDSGRGRVGFLAHMRQLIEQAERAYTLAGLSTTIEMGENRAHVEGLFGSTDAVIGTVQSVSRRLRHYPSDTFSLIIYDEAHHAVKDSLYDKVRRHFPHARLLGVTATPDRLDKRGLGGMFDSVAYTYEIREAIADGWLCPIRQKRVMIEDLDLSACRTTAGDLNEGDLDSVMMGKAVLHQTASAILANAGTRPTLTFGVTVAHATALANELNITAGREVAAVLHGGDDDQERDRVIRRFESGEIQYLANCQLYTEGTDLPFVSCVAVARLTESRAFYTQMVGRGLRIMPGKTDCLVLDFGGNAGKHALVTAAQILGPDITPEKAERIARKAEQDGCSVDEAVARIEEDDRQAELKRRARQAKARIRIVDIDPFHALGIERRDGRTTMPASPQQLRTLEKFGVPQADASGLDRRAASDLLDALFAGIKAGNATFKQRRFLMSRGLRSNVSFGEAKTIIDAIQSNGWNVPDAVLAQYAAASE